MCLGLGRLIRISSNNWLGVWIGLEINLLSFIPLIISKNNLNNSEASLNYFIIQAFASTIIIFSILINSLLINLITNFFTLPILINYTYLICQNLITATLLLKLGAAPFHFWFPNVIENITWNNGLILITWQKVAPIILLIYLILSSNNLILIFTIISTFIGAIGGLNQTSLRKLLAFSSINHIGWIIIALIFNENLWLIYFIIYIILNFSIIFLLKKIQIFYLRQMYTIFFQSPILKFRLITSILSLGGLPPFLGFIPKWLIIQSLIFIKINFINLFIIMIRLITLFYYLKISFSAFILNYNELNWSFKNYFNNKRYIIILNLNWTSLFRFFLIIQFIFL